MWAGEHDGGRQSSNIAEQFDSLLGLPSSAGKFSVLTCAPFILAAPHYLQQPHGSSCVRRGTAHTAGVLAVYQCHGISWLCCAVLGGYSSIMGSGCLRGALWMGWLSQSDFTLANASSASLAAQHPAWMRGSQIVICQCSSPWFPITWGQSLHLRVSLQKHLLAMLCWSISISVISTTCSLSSEAKSWMSHKGSISLLHSWDINICLSTPTSGLSRISH